MNRNRVAKYVIVLFLLAVLSGLTAVMAQGQEPVGKVAMPEATDWGESQPPTPNVYELEPNNTPQNSDFVHIGDVVRGELSPGNDVDYYMIDALNWRGALLIETDAGRIGSPVDTVLSVTSDYGGGTFNPIVYNDDAVYPDSMLYFVTWSTNFFVKVESYGDSTGYYNLVISSPLLISAHAAKLGTGNVAGIPFRSEDVLAWSKLNNGQEKWVMLLDGSDVGFTKPLVNLSKALTTEFVAFPSLAAGFSANLTLRDALGVLRTVKPWDWITFDLSRPGLNTEISNIVHHRGVEHGLTTAGEKLDAISVDAFGEGETVDEIDLSFSTVGNGSVPWDYGTIITLADEDVTNSLWMDGWGTSWDNRVFLDGSTVPGLKAEDVIAASAGNYSVALTIQGSGNIYGHPVSQKDIFAITGLGTTQAWGGILWHGPDHGWNYNIDAIDWP